MEHLHRSFTLKEFKIIPFELVSCSNIKMGLMYFSTLILIANNDNKAKE